MSLRCNNETMPLTMSFLSADVNSCPGPWKILVWCL